MLAVAQTSNYVAKLDQPLETVNKLEDLQKLVGGIVAYVANTELQANYVPGDVSFGFLSKQKIDGIEYYALESILRSTTQSDLLLVADDGGQSTHRKCLTEAGLTMYSVQGPRATSYSSPSYRTYRIAVQIGIVSPPALAYLEQQLNAKAAEYNVAIKADKAANRSVSRPVAYSADNTTVAGMSFDKAVAKTLANQGILCDEPTGAKPSKTTEGKQA